MKNRDDATYDRLVHSVASTFSQAIAGCDITGIAEDADRVDLIGVAVEMVDMLDYLELTPEAIVAAWRAVEPV